MIRLKKLTLTQSVTETRMLIRDWLWLCTRLRAVGIHLEYSPDYVRLSALVFNRFLPFQAAWRDSTCRFS